jgi:competence protein ComEA
MKNVLIIFALVFALVRGAFAAIDINSAGIDELDKLKGIGPVKAKAIVDYRAKNGPFKSIEDLKNVNGVGDATFNAIKNEITVGRGSGLRATPAAKQSTSAPPPSARTGTGTGAGAAAPAGAKGETSKSESAKGESAKSEKAGKDAPSSAKGEKGSEKGEKGGAPR